MNELRSHYVQEEDRLKKDKVESAYLASTSKGKNKGEKRKVLVVSFMGPKGIRRSIALIITHGKLRKTCFLVWFVMRLI